jgi:UDP-2,3-diacylglucosamine hydrolase
MIIWQNEIGATIYHQKVELQLVSTNCTKNVLVAHGDGLGPKDRKYKILKKIFTNPICQWLFRWLHPDIGIKIAQALVKTFFYRSKYRSVSRRR